MRRRSLRSFVVLFFVGMAVLAARIEAPAAAGPPTAIGTGGAAATVDTLATQAADRHAAPRRQRRRRGGRRGRRARGHRAVLLRSRRRRLHGLYRAGHHHGKVITIDGRETAPAAMNAGLVLGERCAASFQRRALQRPLRRRARNRRDLEAGTQAATARSRSPRRLRRRSESPATASSSTRRSSTRPRPTWTGSTTSPRRAALYLDPDGTPHDVGTVFRNPDLAHTYERIALPRREGLLRGQGRRSDRRHRAAPGRVADRQPRLAARAS